MSRFAPAVWALMAVVALGAGGARADNRITVRGQYYREPSTRVIQPVVEMATDLPAGVDLSAHYLLDAITSASAASGPNGDSIFTEYRNESGISVGKTWSRLRLGAAYRYSAESDYWSHTGVLSAALRTWADTATVALSVGLGHDDVGRRMQGSVMGVAQSSGTSCAPSATVTCPLTSVFGGVGYSQVLSPTLLAQGVYEVAVLNGYQSSPYRMVAGGLGTEQVPDNRVRQAMAARFAKYFPSTRTGIQLHYRYYWDLKWDRSDPLLVIRSLGGDNSTNPWQVRSHTVEARIFQSVGRSVEFRVTGRYYSQGPTNFWCDQNVDPTCYTGRPYFTADPKLGPVGTEFVEGKIYWEAVGWRGQPFFGWFSEGTFELSYGMFFQDTQFANAHVLQTGYSLPF